MMPMTPEQAATWLLTTAHEAKEFLKDLSAGRWVRNPNGDLTIARMLDAAIREYEQTHPAEAERVPHWLKSL